MEYISAKEAARNWGISQRRVAVLCSENRIPDVYKRQVYAVRTADGEEIPCGVLVLAIGHSARDTCLLYTSRLTVGFLRGNSRTAKFFSWSRN